LVGTGVEVEAGCGVNVGGIGAVGAPGGIDAVERHPKIIMKHTISNAWNKRRFMEASMEIAVMLGRLGILFSPAGKEQDRAFAIAGAGGIFYYSTPNLPANRQYR
jgi:hypothetical protein